MHEDCGCRICDVASGCHIETLRARVKDLEEKYQLDWKDLRARINKLEEALGEISWSNDSKWQADRAKQALKEATDD